MKHRNAIAASLIAGATLLLSASAAMAQGGHEYHPYRDARPHHVVPVRPHFRHDYRHHHVVPVRSRHDRDGDGVPNRFDARPNNPYRH
ncbi:hypothetical protein [Noviherbaspirillum pedocola]|uniref:Uncharacterized protein n=1 Tax=Noviherbaspirillum pedocola TaxID=2801341 RepID=A0A934T0B0_9BURK|nr:hypothetical protein [Noviherbaspirillum pedocola]MBK4735023.1 hypothetical protein [Noviherbaspirillum pedocola]